MDFHTDTSPSPALVLAIGPGMSSALAEVEQIHCRHDPRRQATTRFLSLGFHGKHHELTALGMRNRMDALSYDQVLEISITEQDAMQNALRACLHELRSHEKLIEVGLGGRNQFPLDVIILGDLTTPDSAVLMPLLSMVDGLLETEPYAKAHLLLGIASFSETSRVSRKAQNVLSALRSRLEEEQRRNLPLVYLFDRYKEGVWEARDADELRTLMGNFTLALLNGGLAQRLAHHMDHLDALEKHAYFCGASATILNLDVEQLQSACAMRLGAEIVDMEFHSRIPPDPVVVEEVAADFARLHTAPKAWTKRLCQSSRFQPDEGTHVKLHFFDLQFEDVPMEDWTGRILSRDTDFKDQQLPRQIELLTVNADALRLEFARVLSEFVRSLPIQTRLYPGGIRAARAIVDQLDRNLQDMKFEQGDPAAIEEDWNARIETETTKLTAFLRDLPAPPHLIYRLPEMLRRPAVQLFNLIFLFREMRTLTELRQACVRLVEQKYEALIEVVLAEKLKELRAHWLMEIEGHKKELKRLQSILDRLPARFRARIGEINSLQSLFRLSALDEAAFSWAYYQGQRPPEGFRHALLEEEDFLNNWSNSPGKLLASHLEEFCRNVYQPLSNLHLQEVLNHRDGRGTKFLYQSMSQGAIPLLRPNFDQTGDGCSFQLRFLLCEDPLSSPLSLAFKEDQEEWEFLGVDNPHVAVCCRVRMMIPNSALAQIFEQEEAGL